MENNFLQVKDYVLTLTNQEESAKLNLQIQTIVAECLAYCYRSDIPEAMILPLADVVANELQKRNLLNIDGDISSYSEGDMSVNFGGNNNTTAKQFYNGKLEPFKQIVGVIKNV
jgi:hypothetical protein